MLHFFGLSFLGSLSVLPNIQCLKILFSYILSRFPSVRWKGKSNRCYCIMARNGSDFFLHEFDTRDKGKRKSQNSPPDSNSSSTVDGCEAKPNVFGFIYFLPSSILPSFLSSFLPSFTPSFLPSFLLCMCVFRFMLF